VAAVSGAYRHTGQVRAARLGLQRRRCMPRKVRKDITVGGIERKLKVPKGTLRHQSGRKVRKDKKLKNIQKG
jgi:hypothetical protein